MTTMTVLPALTGGMDPAFYAGRADAYDEHAAGASPAELTVRAEYIVDFHDPMYAAGYTERVAEIRRETAALTEASIATQADAAHKRHKATRT